MATYYVSRQNGNDANAGTSAGAAKATVTAGLNLMSAGDTLYIGPGRYQEKISDTSVTSGTSGNETKIIGDPECRYLTSDTPGIVRITGCDSSDIPTTGTVWDSLTRNYIWVKNLNIDGASNTYSVNAGGTGQLWENCVIHGDSGAQGGFSSRPVFNNCLIIGTNFGTQDINTIKCVVIGYANSVYKGYHMGTIAMGYNTCFNDCYDQSFEGTTNSSRGSCYNCIAIGALYGYQGCSGYNNMAIACLYGMRSIASEGKQHIGTVAINCERGFLNLDGSITYNASGDTLQNAIYYGTANYSPLNSSVVNNAPQISFGIDAVRHIQKAFEPLNTMPSGTADTNLISLGAKPSGVTNPYIATTYEGTSGTGGSHPTLNWGIPPIDAAGKPIKQDAWLNPGPYFLNNTQSIDISNVSGSEFSIRIDGYGGMNFDMPVSASQSFTASVGVKYNVTSVPPQLIISASYPDEIDSDFTPISVQASGTGDQTGAWQTITVNGSSTIDTLLNVSLLQGDGHPTGSSFAIFSNLQVTE
jgi:hypothetical protein